MPRLYKFSVDGTGSGVAFSVNSEIVCEFAELFHAIVSQTFDQLTSGKAVFGQPGVGCKGPYEIDKIVIERVETRR